MKKILCSLFVILTLANLSSCEELISKGMDTEALKKLRTENTGLKIEVDKLRRQIKKDKEDFITKDMVISLYDLRHAVEKYALNNKGEYPIAENVTDLKELIKDYLPKDYTIEPSYLETIKSSEKGYIFIANINDQKIVVSNLI